MDRTRLYHMANLAVARACGFASLAIFCFMIGTAGYPVISLKTGAVGMMLCAAVLLIKAELSERKPYKRTELWLLLEPSERPDTRFAQQLIGDAMREVYLRFTRYFALAGFGCFAVSVLLQLLIQLDVS
jgi:hypothetical protein